MSQSLAQLKVWHLRIFFIIVLITMLSVTTWASLNENMFQIPLVTQKDPWFAATLFDAYCGFLTFYCWVFCREKKWIGRLMWLVLILLLGNIAMASYALIVLFKADSDAPMLEALLPRGSASVG